MVATTESDENPKVVCGSVLTIEGGGGGGGGGDGVAARAEDLFVLGRRTIHPRRGFWGIPAGVCVQRVVLLHFPFFSGHPCCSSGEYTRPLRVNCC